MIGGDVYLVLPRSLVVCRGIIKFFFFHGIEVASKINNPKYKQKWIKLIRD